MKARTQTPVAYRYAIPTVHVCQQKKRKCALGALKYKTLRPSPINWKGAVVGKERKEHVVRRSAEALLLCAYRRAILGDVVDRMVVDRNVAVVVEAGALVGVVDLAAAAAHTGESWRMFMDRHSLPPALSGELASSNIHQTKNKSIAPPTF